MKPRFWIWALVAAAGAKVAAALGYFFFVSNAFEWQDPLTPRPFYTFATIFVFAVGALLFLIGGRGDRRALDLGVLFLLLSATFTNRPLALLTGALRGAWGPLPRILDQLEMDAFLPFFLWRFALHFPHGHLRWLQRRVGRIALRVSAGAGLALFLLNLLGLSTSVRAGILTPLVDRFSRDSGAHLLFEQVILVLLLPALGMIALRLRDETGEGLRRVRLFCSGLLLGFLPLFVACFGEFVLGRLAPPLGDLAERNHSVLLALTFPFFWTVPFTSAYAVLLHRVLDLRLIARRILQYALARATVLVLGLAPFVLLGAYLYVHRRLRIDQVFSGLGLLELGLVALFGVAMVLLRRGILDAVDRRFFREQYDARQILTELVQRIRTAASPEDLANLVLGGIDRALHLTSSALLLENRRSGVLEDPRGRARGIDLSSPLGLVAASAGEALDVDLEDPASQVARLPEADRHWLVDSQLRLLVPILASSGSLVGLIGLGEKKSELPFLREDRRLLEDVARTAALGLELHRGRERESERPIEERPGPPSSGSKAARECPRCGALFNAVLVYCGNCSHRLDPAPIPHVLPGRYRFEQRLGTGGMGVVYRGTDLALGRPIAAKTLRRVSPEDAMRLRREARNAARVSHLHLAAIYGIETWLGMPIMIFEYLAGGTLSDRLAAGPLTALETVDLGIAMAGALERLHAAEILHRDVKPSNIGYASDGTPKLMDFGIARPRFGPSRETAPSVPDEARGESSLLPPTWIGGFQNDDWPTASTRSGLVAGTLPYLAPEILNGSSPDAATDLWSLSVVLYECILGRRLFAGSDEKQVRVRIQLVRVPELRTLCPESPPALSELFRRALHKSRAERPGSARELIRRLAEARGELVRAGA
ncbi:MAG TPA: protein kinase [Thermoanaerobaculia bacterium]|nr:protein kinase [Thermoanaerobaculia bacterium]